MKTGIDVVPMNERDETRYLVLQHVSGPPVNRATSMTVDERGGTGYITELSTGRIVALPLQ